MKIKIAIAPTYIVIKIKARNSHSKVKSIKAERMKEKIKNKSWVNIYDLFVIKKKDKVWPRGLPLDDVLYKKIYLKK